VDTQTQDMARIHEFVNWMRSRQSITPTPDRKMEPSCISFGEFNNLIYCQLIPTIDGDGDWASLNDPDIRQGVLLQIARDIEHFIAKQVPVDLPLWSDSVIREIQAI